MKDFSSKHVRVGHLKKLSEWQNWKKTSIAFSECFSISTTTNIIIKSKRKFAFIISIQNGTCTRTVTNIGHLNIIDSYMFH